jgi:hypothetical protein
MQILGKLPTLALVSAALASPACIIEADEDSSLTVWNDSDYDIDEIRVAPNGTRSWGANLIPRRLLPGEEVTIDLDCDYWDVRIVDETGLGCEFYGLDLCFTDEVWRLTNSSLVTCGFQ